MYLFYPIKHVGTEIVIISILIILITLNKYCQFIFKGKEDAGGNKKMFPPAVPEISC